MRSLLQSFGIYVQGILKRSYFWAFALFLDPFDLYGRFKPPNWPEVQVPNWLGWAVLAALVFWTGLLTYHELRMLTRPYSAREDDLRSDLISFLLHDLSQAVRSANQLSVWLFMDSLEVGDSLAKAEPGIYQAHIDLDVRKTLYMNERTLSLFALHEIERITLDLALECGRKLIISQKFAFDRPVQDANKKEFYKRLRDVGESVQEARVKFRSIKSRDKLKIIPRDFLDNFIFTERAFTQIIERNERQLQPRPEAGNPP